MTLAHQRSDVSKKLQEGGSSSGGLIRGSSGTLATRTSSSAESSVSSAEPLRTASLPLHSLLRPRSSSQQAHHETSTVVADTLADFESSTQRRRRQSNDEPQITVGSLSKWVNGIKGYRPRYFVLDQSNGVLAYYKCRGPHKYALPLLDSSQRNAIGEEALRLERKQKSGFDRKKVWSQQAAKSQGEVSRFCGTLRHCRVQTSHR